MSTTETGSPPGEKKRRRTMLIVVGCFLLLYALIALAIRTNIDSSTTTTFNPDYDPNDFSSGHAHISSTTTTKSVKFPTDGIIAGGIGFLVLLFSLRGKTPPSTKDDREEIHEPVPTEAPVTGTVEPYLTPEEIIQEDPDFQKWREDHPEVQGRILVDQIALYRDFQFGR